MLKDGAKPSPITHSILGKLYRAAGYGQQSLEAVAWLYQYHGLQPPVVCARRRERNDKTRGSSPHTMLVHGKMHDGSASRRPSGSSQSSSSESSFSQSLSLPTPMHFQACQVSSMSFSYVQGASRGPNYAPGEVSGPAPVSNDCTSTRTQRTKPIIKI